MDVYVLGALDVRRGDGVISLGGPNERAIIARLALTPGVAVSIDELVEGLWPRRQPPTAERTVQSYVSRWRSRLGPNAIHRVGGSYLLDRDGVSVDAVRFRAALDRALARVQAGRSAHALASYDEALALWRGRPCPELDDWPAVVPEIRSLIELHLAGEEERATVAFEHEDPARLVGSIERLVAAEPLRERRWALLMRVLVAAGRRADALRAFQRAREAIVEQLGIEPGRELVELERHILDGTDDAAPAPVAVRPDEDRIGIGGLGRLPLLGRVQELATLTDALDALPERGSSWLVIGEGGIGKTRLCEEVAKAASERAVRVVWGRCWPHGGAPPFWPWTAVLGELATDIPALPTAADDDGRDGGARFAFLQRALDVFSDAARRRPLLLIVDDLHAAEADTRVLASVVARATAAAPIMLLVTARADRDRREVVDLPARRLELGGLPADTIRLFGQALGHDLDDDLITAAAAVTGGNALRLEHALRSVRPTDGVDSVHRRLSDALEVAIDSLEERARLVFAAAAVLGSGSSVGEVAAVARLDEPIVREALEAGTAAHLVEARHDGWVSFSHELVRETVLARLPAEQRRMLHARAAVVLDGQLPDAAALARRAHHALEAAPRSLADAVTAIEVTRRAARAMQRQLANGAAAQLLDRAVQAARFGDGQLLDVELLLERADAVHSAGRLRDARAAYAEAYDAVAEHIETPSDAMALARATLGLTGMWVEEVRDPLQKRRLSAMQQAALDRLAWARLLPGADERAIEALTVRLEVRRAAQAVDWYGAGVGPALELLDRARALGDGKARCDALAAVSNALLAPEQVADRLAMSRELVEAAAVAGESVYLLYGQCVAVTQQFVLGDPDAERAHGHLIAQAEALDCMALLYLARVMRVMLLLRRGRLAEAEAAAEVALATGQAAGDPDAIVYYGAHLLVLRWLQGREQEALALFELVLDAPTESNTDYSALAACAVLAARAGDLDAARTYFDRLLAKGLDALPRLSTFLSTLTGVVEAAAVLGEVEVARDAYERLAPFAERPVLPSLAVACFGSAHRWLGLAARTFGDLDRAVDHLDAAIAANLRFGNTPLAVLCRYDAAVTLARRDGPGDRARAGALLAEAIERGRELGLDTLASRWAASADA